MVRPLILRDMARSAAILLVLAQVLAGCATSGAPSLTAEGTPDLMSQPPNAPTPTSTSHQATSEPTASPAKASPPERLPSEALAVVMVQGLNLRYEPGTTGPIQTAAPGGPASGDPLRLSAGDLVWVLQEELVEGTPWYQIVQDNSYLAGWVSGGPQAEPWLIPFDPSGCPSSLSAALSERPLIRRSLENLVCFGGSQLEAIVYWPTPEESGSDVPCPWPDLGAQWLICPEFVNVSGDGSRQLTVYGTQGREDITRGAWVVITGHYDDERAPDCPEELGRDTTDAAEVAATILSCRTAFVLDEIRLADP